MHRGSAMIEGERGPMETFVGKPLPRFEDRRFLTGAGRYTADFDLPGQAHAVVVRAPHAHAEIAGIDTEAARHTRGVLAVYTSEDLRAAGIGPIPSWTRTPPFKVLDAEGTEVPLAEQYPLATERVRYVGEPVALVVAESPAAGRDAAELVAVDWRPLPAVIEVDAALADGAPLLWPELPSNRSFRWQAGEGRRGMSARGGSRDRARGRLPARSLRSWSRAPRSAATT